LQVTAPVVISVKASQLPQQRFIHKDSGKRYLCFQFLCFSSLFTFLYSLRGDSLGNLFVAAQERIFKIAATAPNLVTTYVGNPSQGSYSENIAATTVFIISLGHLSGDSLGNLYYRDNCRVRKVFASSQLVSTVVTGFDSSGENTPALSTMVCGNALWVDTLGNIFMGDDSNRRVRKLTASTGKIATIAGTGSAGYTDNLPATSAMLRSIDDIVGDTNGNIYFSDGVNGRVRKITTTGILVTYAGDGSSCCSFNENSPATSVMLYSPNGLQIEPSTGKLYISDSKRIVVVDPSTTLASTAIGNGCSGFSGDNGLATNACISDAESIWIDSNSRFYLAQSTYRIRKVKSNIITTFAGNGFFAYAGDGGQAKNAQLNSPSGTFLDSNGNVYIADTSNCCVRLVDIAGIISTVGGTGFCTYLTDDGAAFSASTLSYVRGIWKDTIGNFYFIENSKIRTVAAANNVVTTIAGGGGSSANNILGTSYSFSYLEGIWGDSVGNIFVADSSQPYVKKLSLSSSILSTVVGNGVSGFTDNVPATSGKLASPRGLWSDTIGRLFIADYYNYRIRKVENGIITTFAGTGSGGFTGDGLLATQTNFNNPTGVFGDLNGNIYVADTANFRIRMINAINNIVTTIIGSGSNLVSKGTFVAIEASVSYPKHVAVNTNGILYVTEDEQTNAIRKTVVAASPTSQPSGVPTGQPTRRPFALPSAQPSRQPTAQPTGQPSKQPFATPTALPSSQPSRQPTKQPISSPSSAPSTQPTTRPTCQPTGQPSVKPSSHPTSRPSEQPSSQPTGTPSTRPSTEPSGNPTPQPTGLPSSRPSERPSSQPSCRPTVQPTAQPSDWPSSRPSSPPSSRPTNCPTNQPTRRPSSQPSRQPSVVPSSQPTSSPTIRPSSCPSGQPSTQPSSRPTAIPTVHPSAMPSSEPSSMPTSIPSSLPSSFPTSRPTSDPSGCPSSQPSSVPSNIPSSLPSSCPSVPPTSVPSSFPSGQPSSLPSNQPTSFPTNRPTCVPTSQPSGFPSSMPSSQPSVQPSSYPSSFPTSVPTFQPTVHIVSELKEALMGFYNIKDSLNDKSGNGNNGKAHGGIGFISDRFGFEKSSIQFDGKSGYIEVPTKNQDQLITNFTLSFWIYPNISQLLPGTVVFDKSAYLSETCGWSLIYLNSHLFEFSYSVQHSRRKLAMSSNTSYSVLLDVIDSDWSHITLVKELQSLRAYRDGYLVNSTSIPLSVSLPYSSLPLIIGTSKEILFRNQNMNNSLSFYSGGLDDIFIYDRALSSGQISLLKEFSSPTSLPSSQPSSKPSIQPSSVPTVRPSCLPTSGPSVIPTVQPSGFPSNQPTAAPSSVPTNQPSSLPSGNPTNRPTVNPSGQPTVQPSTQPVSFPTARPSNKPNGCPTSCPSTQPSRMPSSCPTNVPSMRPSTQPSNRPSQQPIGRPSSVPSSQPLSTPTVVPSVQPSARPTNQPTSFPSTQPSSQPTKNRFHCTVTDNKFYSPIRDDCVPCPLHSFLNHTGDDTCYCNGGYSQVGLGLTVNCTICSAGEVSFPGSANCTQCQSGFFANSESNTCELCPFNFYSSASGQTQCTPCPAGRNTATLGSTRVDQCISPIPNFTLGFFALFLVIVIFSWYIVFGKFQRVSFERKVKIVTPNIEKCKQVLLSEEEFHYQHLIVVQDKKNQRTRKFKFFSFAVLSIVLMIVSIFLGFVFFTYQVFFTSLILWRGLQADLKLSPILTLLAEGLKDITEYISLPVDLFYFVALPFLYLFEALATINLNLSSVNVTCAGSQAPIELLINCFILGLLVIIIRSDYQLLFNILLNNLNQRFLLNNVEQRLDAGNIYFSRYFFLCLAVSALNAINPFQVGLRYCMGFVRIDTFGKNHGIAHEVTESCNQVPGAPHFDSFLGYMSTIFAWWLILPALYCLAEVVVPKCKKIDPLKKSVGHENRSARSTSKIFPADLFVDETVKNLDDDKKHEDDDKKDIENDEEKEIESEKSLSEIADKNCSIRRPEFLHSFISNYPGIDEKLLSRMYEDAYRQACNERLEVEKERERFKINGDNNRLLDSASMVNQPSVFRTSVHKVTKRMPFVLAFYYYCKQKYLLMISVDLWVSHVFSFWITVLKKNTLKAGQKEERLLLSQDGHQQRRMTRIISRKESSMKPPGVKQLFSLDSRDFIQGMHLYDLEQMKKQKKLDSLWEEERLQNDHSLPSYYEVCLIVRDELHDFILEPFAGFLALLGIGHFFTPTGRYYWKIVLNNYKIFLMVCLGIWTDDAVEAYGLEEKCKNLFVDGRAFLYPSESAKRDDRKEEMVDKQNSAGYTTEVKVLHSPPGRKFSAQILGVTILPNINTVTVEQENSPKKKKIRSQSDIQNIREVLPAVISVLICSRVILFQIVPSLVLFATVSMTLASFPLFIFNDFLIETLPALIIYGQTNREMAIEKELESFVALHPETKEVLSEEETIRVLSEDYSWRLSLRGIILFWNESRLLQFIQSSLTLFFSFLLLIYTRDLLVYLIVILGILFWFLVTKSFVFLLYLGSSLDLKDSDFPKWLRPNPKRSSATVIPETIEGDQINYTSQPAGVQLDHSCREEEEEGEEDQSELGSQFHNLDFSDATPSIQEDRRGDGDGDDSASFHSSSRNRGQYDANERSFVLENGSYGGERSYDEEKRSYEHDDQEDCVMEDNNAETSYSVVGNLLEETGEHYVGGGYHEEQESEMYLNAFPPPYSFLPYETVDLESGFLFSPQFQYPSIKY
jgi:sugar lactone lactonase YvrE